MPRVSDEYLEQRRQQVVDAARRCFARKGFYETSMQDVFRESELSAGAVYRYFRSKDELIQAISADAFGRLAAVIEGVLAGDPLPGLDEIAARLATAAQELSAGDGPGRIAPAAWAAALHDPAVAAIARELLGQLRALWVSVAQRMQDDGRLAPGSDTQAAGTVLFALLPGFLLQHLILGDVDAAIFERGLCELFRPELVSVPAADR